MEKRRELKRIGLLMAVLALAAPAMAAPQRVVINKSQQMLRAYEGDRLVLQTHVSTGKEGKETPNGRFRAGAKYRMHRSSRYHNAPMPYSVVVNGHYFIHGYTSVPNYPASHGCIRLPLNNGNPARWFYHWIKPGTPISIVGDWPGSRSGRDSRSLTIMRARPVP